MDEKRKEYSSTPRYTPEEREKAYQLFAEEAARIANHGTNVIMDGTAPRLTMRQYARRLLPHFAEIYIRCPLQTAIYREESRPEGLVMANLYSKALERKRTGAHTEWLGEVIGVDTPFEDNPAAECVIDSDGVSIEKGRDRVLDFLATWS